MVSGTSFVRSLRSRAGLLQWVLLLGAVGFVAWIVASRGDHLRAALRLTPGLFALITLGWLASFVLNGIELQVLVGRFDRRVPFIEGQLLALMTSTLNYLPMKAGTVLNGVMLRRRHGLPLADFTALTAGSSVIHLGVALVMAGGSLVFDGAEDTWLGVAFLLAPTLLVAGLVMWGRRREPGRHETHDSPFVRVASRAVDGVGLIFSDRRLLATEVAINVGLVSLWAVNSFWSFKAIGIDAPFDSVLTVTALGILFNRLSIIPGGVGFREAGSAFGSAITGIAADAGFAASIVARAVELFWLLLLGLPAAIYVMRSTGKPEVPAVSHRVRAEGELPKVGMIGPVLPFRGGIAQHTTLLLRAMAGKADVRAMSFTRQYPKILFPGESDRDPDYEGHVEPNTEYLIDPLNPLTWSTAVTRMIAWGPDVVMIPWWQVYWAASFSYMARRLRRAGIPVVFLAHNVTEHEAAAWKRALTRRVLALGSGHVVHTKLDAEHLLDLLPDAKPVMHLHPAYDQFPAATGLLAPEHALELLFFGFVRPYKGLDLLIEAMALLPKDLDVRLTVAGEFWHGPESTRARIAELGLEDKVEVISRYVNEAEVAEYFGRAHALVLPYRSATGSGVVAIAHHYEKPVIVTRVGGLPDVVEDGVTGFVVEPDSPEALAAAIEDLAGRDLSGMVGAVRRFKAEKLTWEGLADAVLEAGGLT